MLLQSNKQMLESLWSSKDNIWENNISLNCDVIVDYWDSKEKITQNNDKWAIHQIKCANRRIV